MALTACAVLAGSANAQAGPYFNDTDTFVGSTTACNGNEAIINIPVTDTFVITDVNFGIVMNHRFRKDVQVTLISPNGSAAGVEIIDGPAPNSQVDDLNVLLDSASANGTINAHGADHNSTASRYQFVRRPDVSLNAFNGQLATGTWQVEVCDNFPNADDGTIDHVQLFFNNFVPPSSDLSLSIVASNNSPNYGSNVTMTVTVDNAGPDASPSATVDYDLPNGMTFVSAAPSGTGTYNNATGLWTVGAVAGGSSATLTIVAEVLSSGSHVNVAEIVAAGNTDPDSVPNNSATNPNEDDIDSVTLTPGSSGGTGPSGEPSLSCAAPSVFDWDTNPWVYGATVLSRSYPGGGSDGTDFTITYSGDTAFRNGNSPETNTDTTGGLSPAENSLYYFQNLNVIGTSVDITIDVGVPGTGVQDFQLAVFDVDYAEGQFRDRIQAQGFLNGTSVTPVLTTGSANSSIGSVVFGIAAADNTDAEGTAIVTFLTPVDQIVLNYSNPEASANVSNQAMALHDFNYCPRQRDFGDVATTYGISSHLISGGVFIGATPPDGEASTQVSVAADGDDLANADDEDTIDFSSLIAGIPGTVDVDVTGSGGFLQMWIDWNGDGDFNDTVDGVSEQVATDVQIVGTTGTANVSFDVPASATLSQTIARLRWSLTSGLGPAGQAGSGEVEDHAFSLTGAAVLAGAKSMALYDPLAAGLYALPGNDVIYTITVQNTGEGPTDVDTVVLIDRIPEEVEFWNGDIDDGGPDTYAGTDPVGFSQLNGSALTFAYGSDVAFGTGTTAPADFSECTVTAADNTYRPDLTYICFNPKGQLTAGDPDPEFSVSFRARIK